MMKKVLFISFLFISCTGFGQTKNTPDAELGIAIRPATVNYALSQGEVTTKTVSVTNHLDKKMQFNLYLNDWTRDSVAAHKYYKPGTHPRSCAEWITLDKTFMELDPGETEQVKVTMQLPATPQAEEEMKWTMLFVESIDEKVVANEKATTINSKMRIGVHIYQTPPNLSGKDIRLISFTSVPGEKNKYRLTCMNEGNVQFDCKSYIELSAMSDGKKTSVEPRVFPIFPGQKRQVDFMVPEGLDKGKYTMMGVVDAGTDVPLEASEAIIEIK